MITLYDTLYEQFFEKPLSSDVPRILNLKKAFIIIIFIDSMIHT